MQLRAALPKDKPAIIDLLRKSLGESTIPKSEILWNWKHEENPFGPSYLQIAWLTLIVWSVENKGNAFRLANSNLFER